MTIYKCVVCNFSSEKKCNFDRHSQSQKHRTNAALQINTDLECIIKKNITDLKTAITDELKADIKEVIKDDIKGDLKDINNKINDVEIEMEAGKRAQMRFNRSVMRILKEDFSTNPPLKKITKDQFIKLLEIHYETKYRDKARNEEELTLQNLILQDFENNSIVKVFGKIILNQVRKDSPELQSVFNTDSNRHNYATKINKNMWLNDKLGNKFKELIIDPIIVYMQEIFMPYHRYLRDLSNDEVKAKLAYNPKFILDCQSKIMNFSIFIVEPKTQEQIVHVISPKLQLTYE